MKEVNLLELARGAIGEQINGEVTNILANILDPNTDAKAARKLTVTLTFKSDENREVVGISAQAKANIVPVKPITTILHVGADKNGNPSATELTRDNPNQQAMFEEEPKVLKLRTV